MSRELLRLRGVQVPPDAFDLDKLPPHLRITFRVLDGAKVVASGKDLAALQRQLRPKVRATLSARATALTRTGVTSWDFGPLPRVFTDGEVKAYPALVDAGAWHRVARWTSGCSRPPPRPRAPCGRAPGGSSCSP